MKLFGLNKKTTDTVVETKKTAEENRLRLLNDDTRFDIRESYKELRTNIMFSLAKKGCKVILLQVLLPQKVRVQLALIQLLHLLKQELRFLLLTAI